MLFTSDNWLKVRHLLFWGVLFIPRIAQSETTFAVNSDVDFGRIVNLPNSDCSLDASTSALVGVACIDQVGTVGDIDITALANQSYSVTLFPPGASSNQISYLPLLENGATSDTYSSGVTGTFNIKVGGTISTAGVSPSPGVATNFVYTIRVDSN